MAKMNKQEPQKPNNEAKNSNIPAGQRDQMVAPKSPAPKGKAGGKGNRSRIGGTAVSGAKSMQPRQASTTNNPQQQQYESYNRDMRRRMEHLGTAPDQDKNPVADQRKKRLEKRKQRLEERRQEVKKIAASGPRNITLGRRNTYFLIAIVLLVIIIIALAILFNNHVLHF